MNFRIYFSLLGISLIIMSFPLHTQAQKKKIKFGQFTEEQKKMTDCDFESGSGAVILLDEGFAESSFSMRGIHQQITTYHRIIKILNKDGLDEGNIDIKYARDFGNNFPLKDIKAVTYNEVDGKWVASELNKKEIMEETVSKRIMAKKLILPDVKVGSIIEYQYTRVSSGFYDWYFQNDLPTVQSSFEFNIPNYIDLKKIIEGEHPVEERTPVFKLTKYFDRGGTSTAEGYIYGWDAEKIPSFKDENFAPARYPNSSHINFILKGYTITKGNYTPVNGNYIFFMNKLLEDPKFGKILMNKDQNLLSSLDLTFSNESEEEKAKKIYYTIQKKIKWDNYNSFYPEFKPAKIIKNKKGDVADINMLLICAMREAGLKAYPIISMTRNRGKPHPLVVEQYKFNYLTCALSNGDGYTLLDASDNTLSFGQISKRALNDRGRLIDSARADWVELQNNAKYETGMGIKLKVEDGKIKGELKGRYKGYAANSFYEKKNTKEKEEKKEAEDDETKETDQLNQDSDIKNRLLDEWNITEAKLINDDKEKPVSFELKIEKDFESEDLIYIEPILVPLFKENPFSEEKRYTPVDLPYQLKSQYSITLEIPEGYVVDGLPEKSIIQLTNKAGKFIYSPQESNGKVILNVNFSVNKLYHNKEEYTLLREFFTQALEKMEGMIVLKKQ